MDDDVSLLVPGNEEEVEERHGGGSEFREATKLHEITQNFLGIAITQIVLGLVVIIGGIICVASSYREIDTAGEGIWCGISIIVCGSLSIAVRYHLNTALVWVCFISNIIASILLAAGLVFAAVSSFSHLDYDYGTSFEYMGLNCGMVPCMVLSVYQAIVCGKIASLNQKSSRCCYSQGPSVNSPYTMAYVQPGSQVMAPMGGAYLAVPEAAMAPSAVDNVC